MATTGRSRGDTGGATDWVAITPNDSTDLAVDCCAVIIAVGGAFKATKPNGTVETVTLPPGQFLLPCRRIWSTGTTATGITAII